MLRITAPEPVTGRVGSIRFVDGVAEVEQVTAAERLFLSTRGYRFEPVPVVQPADPGFPDPADIPDF